MLWKGHGVEVDYTCAGRMEEPQVAMQRNSIFAHASHGQPCAQNAAIATLDGARRLPEAVTSAACRLSQHARHEARSRTTCRTRCDDALNRIGSGETRNKLAATRTCQRSTEEPAAFIQVV